MEDHKRDTQCAWPLSAPDGWRRGEVDGRLPPCKAESKASSLPLSILLPLSALAMHGRASAHPFPPSPSPSSESLLRGVGGVVVGAAAAAAAAAAGGPFGPDLRRSTLAFGSPPPSAGERRRRTGSVGGRKKIRLGCDADGDVR